MARLVHLLLCCALLVSSGWRSLAHAQSRQVTLDASARAFFNQGLSFADKGKVVEAADRFRRALAIRYSPVIAYNLASMLEAQGQLLEATELLYRVEGDLDAEESMRDAARRLRLDVEPKLAQLTVEIERKLIGTTAYLDDIQLIPAQLGAPIPVDPRRHELRLMRGVTLIDKEVVDLVPGAERRLVLGPTPVVPSPAEVARAEQAEKNARERAASDDSILHSPWLWAGVGVAVVGAVVAIAAATLAGGSGGGSAVSMP